MSHLSRILTAKTQILTIAGVALLIGQPGFADTYKYAMTNGKFQTSTGPGKPSNAYNGSFSGTFTWEIGRAHV